MIFRKTHIEKILKTTIAGNDFTVQGVEVNSKDIRPGNLFVTWQGEKLDGHQFCQEAVERGAAAVLVEKPASVAIPQIIVPNSIKAFGQLAAAWRSQFDISVIGVTGSNGKTTTKNMLASILRAYYGNYVVAPQKSFNNHVGVPLTLSMFDTDTKAAVIEMGMDTFGEIHYSTLLARPTVATITHAGPSHLAGVGDLAGVAKAKAEIFDGLAENGVAVLNYDDPFYAYWKDLLQGRHEMTFGMKAGADVTAEAIRTTVDGNQFILVTPQGEIGIQLTLLGEHNVMNALTASACALAAGISLSAIQEGLAIVQPELRRLERKRTKQGGVLIDDSYNANPNSMRKAIAVLTQFPGRKILILGDMKELGGTEKQAHRELGEFAKQAGIDSLLATGELMRETVLGFGQGARHFAQKSEIVAALLGELGSNDVVLVKGSNSMQLNEVVAQLSQ